MKKILISVITYFMLFVFCGYIGTASAAPEKKWRIASVCNLEDPMTIMCQYFLDALKEISGGKIEVTLFDNGKLGAERETVEQIQSHALEVASLTGGILANFVPEWGFYTLPYLFVNQPQCIAWESTNEAKQLRKYLEKAGLKYLAYEPLLFRHVMTKKKALKTSEDMKGVKIRTLENPMFIETYKKMGLSPIPMSFSEVFTSLETNIIDGYETGVPTFATTKAYEQLKHLSMTTAFYDVCFLVMDLKLYNSLSAQEKSWVEKAAAVAIEKEIVLMDKLFNDSLKVLKDNGVTVTYPELEPMEKKMQPIYANFYKSYPTLKPFVEKAKSLKNVKKK